MTDDERIREEIIRTLIQIGIAVAFFCVVMVGWWIEGWGGGN